MKLPKVFHRVFLIICSLLLLSCGLVDLSSILAGGGIEEDVTLPATPGDGILAPDTLQDTPPGLDPDILPPQTPVIGTVPHALATHAPGHIQAYGLSNPGMPAPPEPTPLPPREWSAWPVLPYISPWAVEHYRAGIAAGNLPHVFSVIGDCQSVPAVFLGIYASDHYSLPEAYATLQETIDYFAGSFTADRPGVRDGLSVSAALSPLWADPQVCNPDESPVACDLRINRPSIVFVNLGTNWTSGGSPEKYEYYLRKVVETILLNGSLPILSTKADNIEGDYSLNLATVRVAYEYQVPLWNFWRATDHLPGHGLQEDGVYLSLEAWDVRNFSGLQVLDKVWKTVRLP